MKRFVIICGIAVAVATLFYMTREEWFSFVVIGRLPFTSIILPAAVMMGFWMIIVASYQSTVPPGSANSSRCHTTGEFSNGCHVASSNAALFNTG